MNDSLLKSKVLHLLLMVPKGKAIKARQMAKKLNVKDSDVRVIINSLRANNDIPICAKTRGPRAGYWISDKVEEVRETVSSISGRMKKEARACAGMRRWVARKEALLA